LSPGSRGERHEFRAVCSKKPAAQPQKEKQLNTYFVLDGAHFDSRDEAVNQLKNFKEAVNQLKNLKDEDIFAVREVERTRVIRRSAAGNIITEIVEGSLEKVPRIISTDKLSPVFQVHTIGSPYSRGTFSTRDEAEQGRKRAQAEAEQMRSERQAKADARALLTEADITEVHVSTLADVLERDEEKIDELKTKVSNAEQAVKAFVRQINHTTKTAAELQDEIASLQAQLAVRKLFEHVAARELEELKTATQAYREAIHWDEFSDEAYEKLGQEHRCFPDDDCRGDNECTYEPDDDEIEEYLLDNAEELEIESGAEAPELAAV
jgi:hypothetical protein